MINRLTELLNLFVAVIKARWVFIFFIGSILSVLISLKEWLLLSIELQIPLTYIIVIGVLAAYPVLNLLRWLLFRSQKTPIEFRGLLWKPSRLRFRYPTPICPHCEGTIIFRVQRKSIHFAQSIRDFQNIQEDMNRNIYECPDHGVLLVPNEDIEYLQRLAQAKINNNS